MWTIRLLLCLVLLIISCAALSQERLVFAHFHMPYAPNGAFVEGYRRDIREDRLAGLDGFILNMGAWNGEGGWYRKRTEMMFAAAEKYYPGFRLAISTDEAGEISAEEHIEMMRLYTPRPAYFHYNKRPVLFTWAGEAKNGGPEFARDWWLNKVLGPLRKENINIFFVPYFYVANYDESPDYANLRANYDGVAQARAGKTVQGWWKDVIDGMYYFAGTGLPLPGKRSVIASGEAWSRLMHENGKLFVGGVSPLYWGNLQNADRRYFEYQGGEGLSAQWKSIIQKQKPEWVELFTWTDFTEATYFAPVADPVIGNYSINTEYGQNWFPTHKGFTDLNSYYVRWYKTGKQPLIKEDRLYFFYRTHPADAAPTADSRGPVLQRNGPLKDVIYLTTLLKSPATLVVHTGSQIIERKLATGLVHTQVPFTVGKQSFELRRSGKVIAHQVGPVIQENVEKANFTMSSGIAGAGADLVVRSVSWSPINPAPGSLISLHAVIGNEGVTASTLPANVTFYLDGVKLAQQAILPRKLAAGRNVKLSALIPWTAAAGAHQLEAFVNEDNRCPEYDPYNNMASTTLLVGSALDVQFTAWEGALPDAVAQSDPDGQTWRREYTVDNAQQTIRVYVGGDKSAGRLKVHMEDGSSPDYSEGWDVFRNPKGTYKAVYTITCRSKEKTRLIVEWKRTGADGTIWMK